MPAGSTRENRLFRSKLVLLGYPYSARILLGIRRNFRVLGPYLGRGSFLYISKYRKEPRPNPVRLIGYLLCVAKL